MPTPDEWDAQKPHIRQFYLVESMTLRDLISHMKERGFKATKAQYETHFKAWGFSKNDAQVPKTTWKHIAYKVEKRKRENKDSDVYIDGILLPHKKVKKEIGRHFYSTLERMNLEKFGAPSPPGPSAIVKSPHAADDGLPTISWLPLLNLPRLVLYLDGSFSRKLEDWMKPKLQSQLDDRVIGTHRNKSIISVTKTGLQSCNWASVLSRITDLSMIKAIIPNELLDDEDGSTSSKDIIVPSTNHLMRILLYLISNDLDDYDIWEQDEIWNFIRASGLLQLSKSDNLPLKEPNLAACVARLFEQAIHQDHIDVVTWLLDIGVSPCTRIRPSFVTDHHLPLICLLLNNPNRDLAKLLLSRGASPFEVCCNSHLTAIHTALDHDRFNVLEMFLPQSIPYSGLRVEHPIFEVNDCIGNSRENQTIAPDDDQLTRRNVPEEESAPELRRFIGPLFQLQISNDTLRDWPISPIITLKAVRAGDHDLLRLLNRKYKVQMDCHDHHGNYPLGTAARESFSTTKLLLDMGASPNYYLILDGEESVPALHIAVGDGKTSICQLLLNQGADTWKKAGSRCDPCYHGTPMEIALRLLECNIAELLLLHGSPLNGSEIQKLLRQLYCHGSTASASTISLVKSFIAQGSDLEFRGADGLTALHYAAKSGHAEIAMMLVDAGVPIRNDIIELAVKRQKWETAISLLRRPSAFRFNELEEMCKYQYHRIVCAIHMGTTNGVKVLIRDFQAMASSHEQMANLMEGLLIELIRTEIDGLIELILQHIPHHYSSRCLYEAVKWCGSNDDWKVVRKLLQRRELGPLDAKWEFRAIFLAVKSAAEGDWMLIDWFCHHDRNWLERTNLRSFEATIILNNYHDLQKLLRAGIRPSTYMGLRAVIMNSSECLDLLLASGFQPNRRFPWFPTALQYAVQMRNLSMAERLLQAGADVNAPPRSAWVGIPRKFRPGYRAWLGQDDYRVMEFRYKDTFQLAVYNCDIGMTALLQEHGADINRPAAPVYGATALQIACIKGYLELVRSLISEGANINAAGAQYSGRTALEGASEHGRLDVVMLLLRSGCLIHGPYRGQYIRAVGFARREGRSIVASQLQEYGKWGELDEELLKIEDLDREPTAYDSFAEAIDDDVLSEDDWSDSDEDSLTDYEKARNVEEQEYTERPGQMESKDWVLGEIAEYP